MAENVYANEAPPSYYPSPGYPVGPMPPDSAHAPAYPYHPSTVAYQYQAPNQQFQYPPPPGYGAPNYGAGPAPAQQQQQQVVVVGGGVHPQIATVRHVQSFIGHMIFACIVLWLCNCLFGLIAFILAAVASNSAVADPNGARRLGNASIGISIAGIVVSIITICIIVALLTTSFGSSSCTYTYFGTCYRYRFYVSDYVTCYGVRYGNYCYCNSDYACI